MKQLIVFKFENKNHAKISIFVVFSVLKNPRRRCKKTKYHFIQNLNVSQQKKKM